MADIPDLDDDTFEKEVLKAKVPVVVDFGADWCHPCKQLDPVVEELAAEWDGKVKFLKMDTDINVDTTMKYQVMGLPTLILFKDGEPLERLTGYQPKHRIVHKFEPHLDHLN
jgi:thioredoxin 1